MKYDYRFVVQEFQTSPYFYSPIKDGTASMKLEEK